MTLADGTRTFGPREVHELSYGPMYAGMWKSSLLAASFLLVACGSSESVEAQARAPWMDAVTPVLESYERLRVGLAADRLDVATEATRLASAASAAASGAPADAAPALTALAAAATSLAATSGGEGDDVRRAYGEVSRHLVALLTQSSALRGGRHVFECPMAQGYRRWIQPTAEMANPYMGTRMLRCGREVSW